MKHLPFIRSIASLGKVIFSILSVLQILGAIFLLFGILSMSFLPSGTFEIITETKMEMNVHLKEFFGDDWEGARAFLQESVVEGMDATEDGLAIRESTPQVSMENRKAALTLIPTMTQLILHFFFYRLLAGALKKIAASPITPFSVESARDLTGAGICLFILAALPGAVASLIQLITGVAPQGDASLDLSLVLWGLILLALARLFEYGTSLLPTPTAPTAGNPPTEEKIDPPFHPGAF